MAVNVKFVKSVCKVMNVVGNCGKKIVCKPIPDSDDVLTVVVYKDTAVDIVVKKSGAIKMVFDKQLAKADDFSKEPLDYSASCDKPDCSVIEYTYTERNKFANDFNQIS